MTEAFADRRDRRRIKFESEQDRGRTQESRAVDLRGVLEDAAHAMRETNFEFENAANTAMWVQQGRLEVRRETQPEPLSVSEALMDRLPPFQDALADVWKQQSRLALRIKRDDPCLAGYADAGQTFMRALQTCDDYVAGRINDQQFSTILTECQGALKAAEDQFFEGSRRIIGVEVQ